VPGHTLNVAVAIGEERRVEAALIGKGVVLCRLTADGDSVNATGIVCGILSTIHFTPVTD